ncbi:hypothetical protein M514_05418 [Trichuris suis]|nr:hypothetical protein M514_05418 [Trichuris suis]
MLMLPSATELTKVLLLCLHYGSFLMQPTDPVVEGENDFILGFGNEVLVTILVALLVAPFVSWLAQYTRTSNCIIRWIYDTATLMQSGLRQLLCSISHWFGERLLSHSSINRPASTERDGEEEEEEEAIVSAPVRSADSNVCCVCLMVHRLPTLSNCGHMFCAQCILGYWQHGFIGNALRCPMCRGSVTLLMPCFTAEERQANPSIIQEITSYNRRFSGAPRPWLEYITEIPVLISHMFRQFFSVGNLMWMFRLRIVVCVIVAIVYALSPFDIIPEALFGLLGMLDDIFVVVLLLVYLSIAYRRFISFHLHR